MTRSRSMFRLLLQPFPRSEFLESRARDLRRAHACGSRPEAQLFFQLTPAQSLLMLRRSKRANAYLRIATTRGVGRTRLRGHRPPRHPQAIARAHEWLQFGAS